MGWEDILKNIFSIKRHVADFHPFYEELIAHPSFNINDDYLLPPTKRFLKDIMEGKINLLDFNDETLQHEEQTSIMMYIGNLQEYLRLLKKEVKERSMKLLEDMATTFGVKITRRFNSSAADFTHLGLKFYLHGGGVDIYPPNSRHISVCVVDEKNLPLGDFFASMLGLIVARPEELDVVHFGIELARIIQSYSDYDWMQAAGGRIGIFTPFNASNSENEIFYYMIGHLYEDDSTYATSILEEIEGALQDCFGSTNGFF